MKKYKTIFLLSLFVMLEFFSFRLNVYADYKTVSPDSSNMVKSFSADTYSNEKIFNLKINAYFSEPYSSNHAQIEKFRRYAYANGLRNPDNPSQKLNASEYKPLQVSSRLGVIASIREYERRFNNVYYRLDGRYYNTLYVGGLNSDCEYLKDSNVYLSAWLEKEQTKWRNGEKTSDLYKYIIGTKYKSYNVVNNLFEFSKKSDNEKYENNESYYTIPIKSSKILYRLKSPTYISKGNAYQVTTSLYLWNDNYEDFRSVSVKNEEYISTEDNKIIDAYKENYWNWKCIAGKNVGKAKVNVWLESGPKITFDVGVDQIITSNPPQNDRSLAGEWTKYNNDWYYHDSYGNLATGWKDISNKTYYFAPNNVMQKEWKQIKSKWYYLGQDGALRKGWFEVNNSWYYSDSDGIMQKNSWIGNYYVNSNGSMAKNQWIGNYYVDGTGKWVPNKAKVSAGWHKTKEGAYWYQNADGSYPKKQWKEISKRWYHFNETGYMDHNKWIGDYYVKDSGEMATNEWIGKYYVASTGKWVPNKAKVTAGWHKTKEGAYWYQNSDGSYPKKQWQKINSHWYHFNDKGYMDHDKWIGYYYVKSSGEMATNEWIDKFYVDGTGIWDPKKVDTSYGWRKTKEGAFWYQEKNGSFPKNQWKQIDGQWYHFNESGYMDHDKWVGYYYVKSNGVMAKNERIGIFYVGSDGLWQPGV